MKHTAILPIVSVLLLSLALAGCATHGAMQLSEGAQPLAAGATFQNEEVKDVSGFDWGTEKDRVDIVASLKAAIDWELTQANLAGTGYVLRTDIVRYEPGNAFKRWLMPGFGATRLNVVGKVFTREGALVATVPVERYVGFGGGFTIGAWKDVFQDVAKEIVRVLKKGCAASGASSPKSQDRAPAGESAVWQPAMPEQRPDRLPDGTARRQGDSLPAFAYPCQKWKVMAHASRSGGVACASCAMAAGAGTGEAEAEGEPVCGAGPVC